MPVLQTHTRALPVAENIEGENFRISIQKREFRGENVRGLFQSNYYEVWAQRFAENTSTYGSEPRKTRERFLLQNVFPIQYSRICNDQYSDYIVYYTLIVLIVIISNNRH